MLLDRGAARGFAGVVAAAKRRALALALAEAAAWGGAATAASPVAGALVAVALATWRLRAIQRVRIIRDLERAQPSARNLFVTADEIERDLLAAKPAVRERVRADAAASAETMDLRRVYPIAPVVRAALLACAAWVLVWTGGVWRGPLARIGSGVLSRSESPAGDALGSSRMRVVVTVRPPAHTGLEPTILADPEQVQAIDGAALVVSVESSADGVTLEHDRAARTLARGADGRFVERVTVTKTGYLLVAADNGGRRTIPVVVSPDALPAVRVTTPGRDLVYSDGNPRIAFETRATDDFGLRSLALRYTKVSGSGEQFDFDEGDIPLTLTRTSAREWTGTASRSLTDLNLKDGDMLVYRAVAADTRPGDGSASSDAFFIEISRLGVAAGDAFTLPEEETRYALSQQMLIIKTERLHQRRASMAPDEFTEAALNLAVEQRMIRAEIVFMLGGEVQDEEVEAEQSSELQEGRLQNRGQRDLRTATTAMSRAEKLLTGTNTADALVAERAAVTALQRAFSRERYILRALATRSQLDPARRLTGNLAEAADWRRSPPNVGENRRTALLQDLLRGIAELSASNGPGPTGGSTAEFRQRALVLAEEAIRIDPAAAQLRQAATELQRAANAIDPAQRSRALASAATAAASEARRAHAEAPLASPGVAPALTGAFYDALNARLKGSRYIEGERR